MNYKNIEVQYFDRIVNLKLNRPEKRNALNKLLIHELTHFFKSIKKNKKIKIIIFEGNGKSFCAGMDLEFLKNVQHFNFKEHFADAKKLVLLLSEIYQSPKLIIAKVKGEAFAGGAGLLSVSDIICASENSKFSFTEVKIGFVPAIVSFFLRKKINQFLFNEILLTGKIFNSHEALKIGFINYVFNDDEIDLKVSEMAEKYSLSLSENSIFETKNFINKISKNEKIELNNLAKINAKARLSKDCKTGISKFLNKEKIIW